MNIFTVYPRHWLIVNWLKATGCHQRKPVSTYSEPSLFRILFKMNSFSLPKRKLKGKSSLAHFTLCFPRKTTDAQPLPRRKVKPVKNICPTFAMFRFCLFLLSIFYFQALNSWNLSFCKCSSIFATNLNNSPIPVKVISFTTTFFLNGQRQTGNPTPPCNIPIRKGKRTQIKTRSLSLFAARICLWILLRAEGDVSGEW